MIYFSKFLVRQNTQAVSPIHIQPDQGFCMPFTCLNLAWAEPHLNGMCGGLPPDGLPAALHNCNLLPSFDQTATLKLIDAPAASKNDFSNNQEADQASISHFEHWHLGLGKHLMHIQPCSSIC